MTSRVGIAGYGVVGRRRRQCFDQNPHTAVVALAEQRFGRAPEDVGARTYADYRAMIEQEEIFGPVLAVIKAKDYDDALEIANDTQFGLTGAVYSADEEKLKRARREFHVGNLYLNRKCTGALVGVHPFGGFNMSGTDSKAGGRDYLLLFMQAKVSAEKLGATKPRGAEAST